MKSFDKYNEQNPVIWDLFVRFAYQAKHKGFSRYSAKGIFELIRWHTAANSNDRFKINNNYHADYARRLMNLYPEFKGFFETRNLTRVRS